MEYYKTGARPEVIRSWPIACLVAVMFAGLAGLPASSAAVPAFEPLRQVFGVEVSRGVIWETWVADDPMMSVQVARLAKTEIARLRPVLSNELVAESSPVTRLEHTSRMCLRMHCVVAVNGDQWVTEEHSFVRGAPVGATVIEGELITTARPVGYAHLLFDRSRQPSLHEGELPWEIELMSESGLRLEISDFNRDLESGELSLLGARWGPETLTPPDTPEWVLHIDEFFGGGRFRVSLVEKRKGPGPIPAGHVVLTAGHLRWEAADEFFQFIGSDPLDLEVRIGDTFAALGGTPILLDGSEMAFVPPEHDKREPRTLIGWDADGTMLMVTVDGRQSDHSVGASLSEAAQIMRSLGATHALNVDGGGSTTFVAGGSVRNRPSDPEGRERRVVSSLVVGPIEGFEFGVPEARPIDEVCPDGKVPQANYTDVADHNVHREPIDCLTWRQITQGVTPDQYGPTLPVSREQMATFLVRALEQSGMTLPPAEDHFPDDQDSVHHDSINRLAVLGVVTGRGDGTYGPREPVTRAQMASFLMRTHQARTERVTVAESDYFGDDGLDIHQPAINAAAQLGIVAGRAPDSYAPLMDVRRDQMASFVLRAVSAFGD